MKRFIAKKFNRWYCGQISSELEAGTPIGEIDVKLRLSILKPLHAGWVVDFYNHITSAAGKSLIENGCNSSRLTKVAADGSVPRHRSFSWRKQRRQ